MEGKEELSSNVCPTCQKEVEILNNDLCFSMRLHMWTHKPVEVINQEMEEQPKKEQFESINMNTVKNNFGLEYQNNKRSLNNGLKSTNKINMSGFIEADKNSASPSGINKTSKDIEPYPIQQPIPFNPLEELFNSIESKLHRGFFAETNDGMAFCKICNVTVQPMIKVIEHLKTRLHENNTIQFLTSLLPDELHHIMESVSFYCSSLFCRLCGFKIYSCSTNPNEAIHSITLHNLSKGHMARDQSNSGSKQGSIVVESLANVNPIINNNQHLLEVQTKTEFRCMLCNKVVGRNLNEKELNSQFNKHFLSKPHLESLAYSELAAFENRRDIDGKGRHNFILADCKLCCTICGIFVEPKVEALILHVSQSLNGEQNSTEVNLPTTSCISTTSNQTTVPKNVASESTKLSSLLNSLPEQLRNIDYIVENDIGETICLICDIKYPPPSSHMLFNLKTHLLGRKHKNKAAKKTKWTSKEANIKDNLSQNISTTSIEKNTFMQKISKEEFHCNVCNTNVPSFRDHLKEARHMNLALVELSKTDEAIKTCMEHITIKNGYYICEICDNFIMNHNTTKHFKSTILSHMSGKKHLKCMRKRQVCIAVHQASVQ